MKRPNCTTGMFWCRLALESWRALAVSQAENRRLKGELKEVRDALLVEGVKRTLVEARESDLERREAAAAAVIRDLREALDMYGGAAHFTSPQERGVARVRALHAAAAFLAPLSRAEECHGGH